MTCHDSSSCKASASGTGGRRLKTQVKVGRWAGGWMGVIYVGLLPFARKLQYTPFTSTEYAFLGSSKYESNEITIYGKKRSLFILSSKGVKHYSIILIILTIIIAPQQLGNHPMQLELHSSAFKNINLVIYRYISATQGDSRWNSVNLVLGSTYLLLFLVKLLFQNVNCVSSK